MLPPLNLPPPPSVAPHVNAWKRAVLTGDTRGQHAAAERAKAARTKALRADVRAIKRKLKEARNATDR